MWSHEASSRSVGQELTEKPKLAHDQETDWAKDRPTGSTERAGPQLCNAKRMGSGYRERQMGSPTGGQSTGNSHHRKPFVPPLPVLSFLLLRRVHELICWQLQDK